MDATARAALAGILCFVVAALVAFAVLGRFLLSCVRLDPCPNGPPCIGLARVCQPSSAALSLALLIGVVAGAAGGFLAYKRDRRLKGL
jgi:H+/Cl- antiporter ClcA